MSANNKIPSDRKLVTGLGSALVDILIHESDDFVLETGKAKGGMDLVEKELIRDILLKSKAKQTVVPGRLSL